MSHQYYWSSRPESIPASTGPVDAGMDSGRAARTLSNLNDRGENAWMKAPTCSRHEKYKAMPGRVPRSDKATTVELHGPAAPASSSPQDVTTPACLGNGGTIPTLCTNRHSTSISAEQFIFFDINRMWYKPVYKPVYYMPHDRIHVTDQSPLA